MIIESIRDLDTLNQLIDLGYVFTCDQLNANLQLFTFTSDRRDIQLKNSLELLKWLNDRCRISDRIILGAADFRAFQILKWLYTNKYTIPTQALDVALINSDQPLADWLFSIGVQPSQRIIQELINEGDITQLIKLHAFGVKFIAVNLTQAAEAQQIELMDWLDSIGVRASNNDMLELLDDKEPEDIPEYLLWLYTHKYAVPKDKLDMLKRIQNEREKG